eukprot:gene5925-6165_t
MSGWGQRVKVCADSFLVEKLRPHQREGVRFIFECLSGVRKDGCFGAILADGMGLGKTFQTIASLYCLLTKGIDGSPTCKKPLILCPTSLVQNWGSELRRWLGDRCNPIVVDDTKAEKVKKSLQEFRGHGPSHRKPLVLVMSYPCFRVHKAEVYKLGIDVVMCDEAHFLKNSDAQITQAVAGLPSRRRLLMSGTPIQNDLSEFYAVFTLACPGLLGSLAEFRKTYEIPIQNGRDAGATDKQVALGLERMSQLMGLCNRFMLRRTSSVLKQLLPTKVEQVVFCKLSPLQLKLYNAFLQSQPVRALLASTAVDDTATAGNASENKPKQTRRKEADAMGEQHDEELEGQQEGQEGLQPEKQNLLAPLAAITALKKLCCHPDLILEMLKKKDAQRQLSAQQQQLSDMLQAQKRMSARRGTGAVDYAALAGQHQSDDDEEAAQTKKKRAGRKSSSSSARQQLTGFEGCEQHFAAGDVYPPYQAGRCQAYHSGKVMVLEALLKAIRSAEPTDKVVLVSNYTEALDVLQVMCSSHGWVALRLDGSCSVKQRQALVDTFNDGQHPSFVLLLSSKAGGVGLNIIGANRLVLFDPDWNPANDLQAMARVWREGQSKRVWIYRMLMAGSIEEKVLQRQLAKQGLSEALVDEVGQETRTFSRNELRSLFRVNPTTPCETHNAIKCSCDGSAEAMATCLERVAGAAAVGGNGSEKVGQQVDQQQQGVLAWAHLAKASDSPDPTWQAMLPFVRDNFVTYVFSDHVLDETSSAAARGPAGSSRQDDLLVQAEHTIVCAADGTGVGVNLSDPPGLSAKLSNDVHYVRVSDTNSKPQLSVDDNVKRDAAADDNAGNHNSKTLKHGKTEPRASRGSKAAGGSKAAAASRRRSSKASAHGAGHDQPAGPALTRKSIAADNAPSPALAALAAAAVVDACPGPEEQQGQAGLILLCETAAMHLDDVATAPPVLAAEVDHYHEQQDDDALNMMLAHAEAEADCYGW